MRKRSYFATVQYRKNLYGLISFENLFKKYEILSLNLPLIWARAEQKCTNEMVQINTNLQQIKIVCHETIL